MRSSPTDDPTVGGTESVHVIRGGDWYFDAGYCRSAVRSEFERWYQGNFLGLRVSRVAGQ